MGATQYEVPFPDVLAGLVPRIQFTGIRLELADVPLKGLCLLVVIDAPDTYNPDEVIEIKHYLPVPAASHDERNWARWVLEQILLAQRHEAMENFKVDGRRPFAPGHGGGHDPYYPVAIY